MNSGALKRLAAAEGFASVLGRRPDLLLMAKHQANGVGPLIIGTAATPKNGPTYDASGWGSSLPTINFDTADNEHLELDDLVTARAADPDLALTAWGAFEINSIPASPMILCWGRSGLVGNIRFGFDSSLKPIWFTRKSDTTVVDDVRATSALSTAKRYAWAARYSRTGGVRFVTNSSSGNQVWINHTSTMGTLSVADFPITDCFYSGYTETGGTFSNDHDAGLLGVVQGLAATDAQLTALTDRATALYPV